MAEEGAPRRSARAAAAGKRREETFQSSFNELVRSAKKIGQRVLASTLGTPAAPPPKKKAREEGAAEPSAAEQAEEEAAMSAAGDAGESGIGRRPER
jgi:hypothetical protein